MWQPWPRHGESVPWRSVLARMVLLALVAGAHSRGLRSGVAADSATASGTLAVRPARQLLQCQQCPDPGELERPAAVAAAALQAPVASPFPQLAPASRTTSCAHPTAALSLCLPLPAAAASSTCSALDTLRQNSIRNQLISSCSTTVLAASSGTCCGVLAALQLAEWQQTLACMW